MLGLATIQDRVYMFSWCFAFFHAQSALQEQYASGDLIVRGRE